jgi:hypothetical protein
MKSLVIGLLVMLSIPALVLIVTDRFWKCVVGRRR